MKFFIAGALFKRQLQNNNIRAIPTVLSETEILKMFEIVKFMLNKKPINF